jgi:hypothetical protein
MMTKVYLAGVTALLSLASWAQTNEMHVMQTASISSRLPVIRASLNLPESHEQTFCLMYEEYEKKHAETFQCAFLALSDLAGAKNPPDDQGAFDCVSNLILHRCNALDVKGEYFESISRSINGRVALQFLQAEELMDLMAISKVYEKTAWRQPPMHLDEDEDGNRNRNGNKRQWLRTVLSLQDDKDNKFWPLYEAYEAEYDSLLGEDLGIFEQYIRGSDLTPAQARRVGQEFLRLQRNEEKLRQKYFLEIDTAMGSSFAARFVALDDYFSTMAKMKTWADMLLEEEQQEQE